jgi:hypothetical protein
LGSVFMLRLDSFVYWIKRIPAPKSMSERFDLLFPQPLRLGGQNR